MQNKQKETKQAKRAVEGEERAVMGMRNSHRKKVNKITESTKKT